VGNQKSYGPVMNNSRVWGNFWDEEKKTKGGSEGKELNRTRARAGKADWGGGVVQKVKKKKGVW